MKKVKLRTLVIKVFKSSVIILFYFVVISQYRSRVQIEIFQSCLLLKETFIGKSCHLHVQFGKLKQVGIHLSHLAPPNRESLHLHSPLSLQVLSPDPTSEQLHSKYRQFFKESNTFRSRLYLYKFHRNFCSNLYRSQYISGHCIQVCNYNYQCRYKWYLQQSQWPHIDKL